MGGSAGSSGCSAPSQAVSPARSMPGGVSVVSIPTRRYATRVAEAREREPAVRRRLVEAATRLFAEKGYENASVSEVVAAAGVTKGSMYHYFQAKDDLLLEIYQQVLAMQMDRLERLPPRPGAPPHPPPAGGRAGGGANAGPPGETPGVFPPLHSLWAGPRWGGGR